MKYIYIGLLVLLFSGCSSSHLQQTEPKVNLVEIENRAEAAYLAGHLDMAEGLYRQLIKLKDSYPPAWFRLGNIYTRTNRLDAAISAYQRCIQLDVEHDKAWYNLAIARMRQATEVLIEAQKHLDENSAGKAQMDELFIQLMRLQTGKKD
ncbi:tetratricopeptide repeat protein [Pseudoalteromonas sp. NEC-BIFX-2020_002]|uniref:tetratricopeptide repeat protein n=1 Tax=Pseudoalteromonas sp. NEC-BIFX-2020_002 TaxID=2732353 RepID=UPI001476A23F|nr:tetratricopeptide repeat protein [Pseudoalteromonas sp. NEC-BIFX-2020_002]NNG43692.1 tetratricopeptide repeat protein [Pseudoalteromonas sp. NEC-BIFX-2020_002]